MLSTTSSNISSAAGTISHTVDSVKSNKDKDSGDGIIQALEDLETKEVIVPY
jgi:hypothetical protein